MVDRTGGTTRLFVDGVERTELDAIRSDLGNRGTLNLGRFTNSAYYFKGALDEVRVEAVARSSNWVWATWMTVASNTALAAYSSVTQQQPQLSCLAVQAGLLLTWPACGVGFRVYTTTNLAPPVTWTAASNLSSYIDGQWQVQLAPDASSGRFYRLISP